MVDYGAAFGLLLLERARCLNVFVDGGAALIVIQKRHTVEGGPHGRLSRAFLSSDLLFGLLRGRCHSGLRPLLLHHLSVDLPLNLRVLRYQSVFFEADFSGFLVQIVDEHDQFLIQEAGIFRLGKYRFGHRCRHCRTAAIFVLLFGQSVLSDLIVDAD